MSTHERVIRGMLYGADVCDEQIDGLVAYIESATGQTPPRPATETHKPLSVADTNPAEQLKRRERWFVWFRSGNSYSSFKTEDEAANAARAINGTYSLMREVLPGDPSPETIAETVAELRMVANCPPPASSKYLNALADTLEGK